MNPSQIDALKALEVARKAVINATIDDLPEIIKLLEKAQLICKAAPLFVWTRADGSHFANPEERQLCISQLERETKELRSISEKDFASNIFNITCTIGILMISISGKGLSDIQKILKE